MMHVFSCFKNDFLQTSKLISNTLNFNPTSNFNLKLCVKFKDFRKFSNFALMEFCKRFEKIVILKFHLQMPIFKMGKIFF